MHILTKIQMHVTFRRGSTKLSLPVRRIRFNAGILKAVTLISSRALFLKSRHLKNCSLENASFGNVCSLVPVILIFYI